MSSPCSFLLTKYFRQMIKVPFQQQSILFQRMLGEIEFDVNRLSKHTLEKANKAKLHLEAYYKVTILLQIYNIETLG